MLNIVRVPSVGLTCPLIYTSPVKVVVPALIVDAVKSPTCKGATEPSAFNVLNVPL